MASFNKVILCGNLTRNVELRYTPKGTAVATIGLAVNRKWKTDAGEEREEVTFVDVDVFGRTAEVMGQYLKKGAPILVEGRLKLEQWDDRQTNQKRSKLKVVCETFQFLRYEGGDDAGEERRPASTQTQTRSRPENKPAESTQEAPTEYDDDVPF